MKPTLSALIHPYKSSDFFLAYEKNIPFVVHGLSQTIGDLTSLPFLQSLEDLLNSWPKDVQVHLPSARDEASSIDTTPKHAQQLFDNKMGLLFNHAETISLVLERWLHSLRIDLGLSALTMSRCLMYATPANGGTAAHFDQNSNFVLQISGNKKWWIAPNTHVTNPMTRHTIGLETDPELASYVSKPMPQIMPEDATLYDLKAGSLLFVPRGSWHKTSADTDALSLNFTFSAPTWIDLFSAALRGRLAQSSDWRETANGVSNPDKLDEAIIKFDRLLDELKLELPHWRAADILEATES